MHLTSKENIHQPIRNPGGEVIYELTGAAEEAGGARQHSLAYIVIPPGGSSSRHYHRQSEETYYILRGRARMVLDGRELSLVPGQALLIQPPEQHQIANAGEDDLEFLAICAPAWTAEDSFSVA